MSTPVNLIGRVGSDPELRFTPNGKAVASFPVVTSRNFKDSDGKWQESETTWWRVSVWEKQAEHVVESLRKGDSVVVNGRAYMESYADKDGVSRQDLRVQAYNVALDLKRNAASASRTERSSGKPQTDQWSTGDQGDIPPF